MHGMPPERKGQKIRENSWGSLHPMTETVVIWCRWVLLWTDVADFDIPIPCSGGKRPYISHPIEEQTVSRQTTSGQTTSLIADDQDPLSVCPSVLCLAADGLCFDNISCIFWQSSTPRHDCFSHERHAVSCTLCIQFNIMNDFCRRPSQKPLQDSIWGVNHSLWPPPQPLLSTCSVHGERISYHCGSHWRDHFLCYI